MQCVKCGEKNTKVVDSRSIESGKATRRRRKCEKCDFRFSTFERIEITELVVTKNDGTTSLYSREKLSRGIWLSCGKLKITREDIENMIRDLEEKWFLKKEITTKQIGENVMSSLKDLNKIAYIRFASVYREFKDIEDFQTEIQKIFTKK